MILTYIAALPAHCGRSQAARRIFGNGWLRLLSRSGCCGSKTISVRRSWQSLSAAERWPMRSSSASAEIPPTGARSAMPDSGAGRAIPTISSNGSAGSPIPSSDSRSIILGDRDVAGTDLHVLDPGLRHGHSLAGSIDAAPPRRAPPRLSAAHESRFFPLPPKAGIAWVLSVPLSIPRLIFFQHASSSRNQMAKG